MTRNPYQSNPGAPRKESANDCAARRLKNRSYKIRILVNQLSRISKNSELHATIGGLPDFYSIDDKDSIGWRIYMDQLIAIADKWVSLLRTHHPLIEQQYRRFVCTNLDIERLPGMSEYRGVTWYARSKLWRARLQLPDGARPTKYSRDETQAAHIYDGMVREYCPENLHWLNYVTTEELHQLEREWQRQQKFPK